MPPYLEQSLAKLEWFEGSIPWMYLDTRGNVTVGVGLMLPHAAAAQRLPFLSGSAPATPEQIAAEFERIHAMPMGRPALFYRREGELVLEKSEIDALLRSVLLGIEAALRTHLPTYDGFPDHVKLALLDMAYNLGPEGLLKGFPQLIEAVRDGDFARAAATCFRHGPGASRNQWTQQMFQSAILSSVKGEGESALKNLGFGLVGLVASLCERIRK